MTRNVTVKGNAPFRKITRPENMVTVEETDIRKSAELDGFKKGFEWLGDYTLKLLGKLNERDSPFYKRKEG